MTTALSPAEQALRELIMRRVQEEFLTRGSLTRDELMRVDIGDGQFRAVIDYSRGIRNPQEMQATLSIVSSPSGPYQDASLAGGMLRYDYRSGSTQGDNAKLRRARDLHAPLILFLKPRPNEYIPVSPVYVMHDNAAERYFLISVDPSARLLLDDPTAPTPQREYAERIVRQRLHQPMFRGLVMRAYQVRCAVCRLRHGELLDAAHITPDADVTGVPSISNGLSLCKIHHAAFDRNLLGVNPDFEVRINRGLLEEADGPMLRHGLQEMHGTRLTLPLHEADRPDQDRLQMRFQDFTSAGG